MKVYDYLFYKIYKLVNFLGDDFYPEAKSWFISSMFLWLNMLAVLNFVELGLERALTNTGYVIALYILYLILTYIYFFRKERYRIILQTYDKQASSKKKFGTIIVTTYILVTLVLHFYFSEQRREMALGGQ